MEQIELNSILTNKNNKKKITVLTKLLLKKNIDNLCTHWHLQNLFATKLLLEN